MIHFFFFCRTKAVKNTGTIIFDKTIITFNNGRLYSLLDKSLFYVDNSGKKKQITAEKKTEWQSMKILNDAINCSTIDDLKSISTML